MLEFIFTLSVALGVLIGLPVLFMVIIPWDRECQFKKYFDMTVVPRNDDEKLIAKPYMTARLEQYETTLNVVCKKGRLSLTQPKAGLPGEVDHQIKELRKLAADKALAESRLVMARRIYESLYPPQEYQGSSAVHEI